MVFFTSILIVIILYYLQADGLIYVTIIAVIAELVNMFMTQALTKSVEKKLNTQWGKKATNYKKQIAAKDKAIKELEKVQEDSIQKLYLANKKVKAYEDQLGVENAAPEKQTKSPPKKTETAPQKKFDKNNDLPCGSGGIKRRV